METRYFKIADRTMLFEGNPVELHVSGWKNGLLLQRFLANQAQFDKALAQALAVGEELTLEQWQAIR